MFGVAIDLAMACPPPGHSLDERRKTRLRVQPAHHGSLMEGEATEVLF
jgi:hypothetical protein